MYIYIYRSEGFALTGYDIPGSWRMGLGCSGKILPSPPSPSPSSSPTRIWEMGSYRFLLRNRRFRSARIDASRLPSAEGYTKNIFKKCLKKTHIKKELENDQTHENAQEPEKVFCLGSRIPIKYCNYELTLHIN